MKCISGNSGQFVCVNRGCELGNVFVCADPTDRCKDAHQSCSLLNLAYILRKSQGQPTSNRYETLIPIYDKAKSITNSISSILSLVAMSRDIDKMLTSGMPLSSEDKEKIAKFAGDKKLEINNEDAYQKIEKQLQDFQYLITKFQLTLKAQRSKEIHDLKKMLVEEEKGKRISEPDSPKLNKISKISRMEVQPFKSKASKYQMETPVRIQKHEEEYEKLPSIERTSKVSHVKAKNQKTSEKLKGFGFQQKISSILKNHVPKSPLFSRITNDIKTINSFFNNKFEQATLLYRASENEYLVSKFHEKCDGRKHTITLILTEFDKIIGGYTPLPWRTGTGEWDRDEEGQSFLFNISSGQKYALKTKQKAIWCSKGYGPSFGHPDLEIADKAFYNSNSCANFPNCYNNGNYQNNPGSTQLFCGTKNGHFRIKEWQVYEITFS